MYIHIYSLCMYKHIAYFLILQTYKAEQVHAAGIEADKAMGISCALHEVCTKYILFVCVFTRYVQNTFYAYVYFMRALQDMYKIRSMRMCISCALHDV